MATAKEMRATMRQVAEALRLMTTMDDFEIQRCFGIDRNTALSNFARLLEEAAGREAEADFQVSGITDAPDDDRTFMGYRISVLRAAFEAVCDSRDWKAPIGAWITESAFEVTAAAVRFFTATELRKVEEGSGDAIYVEADGYRAGPAGDQ